MIYTSCSWCHTENPSTEEQCSNCGHDAHRSRLECTCPQCVVLLELPDDWTPKQ